MPYTRYPENSIVYQRPSKNIFWERIRSNVEKEIPYSPLNYSAEITKNLFITIAQQEKTKELRILEKFLPTEEILDTDSYIDKINLLMQNRNRYTKLLKRMEDALTADKSSGAPNMSTFFASYLEPILIEKMEIFQEEFLTLPDPKKRYIELINEAMKETSTKMAMSSTYQWNPITKKYTNKKSTAGGQDDWREINRALKDIPGMWELFTRNVMKSIGNWDKLYSSLVGENIQTVKDNVESILKLKNRMFSIGGNVVENAAAAVAVRLNRLRGKNSTMEYSISGGALTVEGPATADSFLIFSTNTEISPTHIFEELNSATDATYKEKLQTTVSEFKNNLDNLFGIFINAKNYSIGKQQDAIYTKNFEGSFEELPETFQEFNVSVPNIHDFLIMAYNSAEGAIMEEYRGEIEESLVQALRVAAAKIMFDDYATIGNIDQGNIIHLYQLSGKFIPSSVIFENLAEAMDAAQVHARVHLPGKIEDPMESDEEGWDIEGKTGTEINDMIYNYWNEEFERLSNESYWYLQFTLNVKRALGLKI